MMMRKALASATAAVLGLGAVLASGVAAQAQNSGTTPPAPPAAPGASSTTGTTGRRAGTRARREYRAPILNQMESAKIELTADQKTKIKTLTDKMMADRKALEGKTGQSTQARQLGQKFRSDVMAVLTEEQKTQLRNARGTARQNRGAGRAGRTRAGAQPGGAQQPGAEPQPAEKATE